jgi:hypothetical protein
MKRLILCCWILAAPAAVAYHLTAGPAHLQAEAVGSHLRAGRGMARQELWGQAIFHFEHALELLTDEQRALQHETRLELAQAKMKSGQLPEAHGELKSLFDEVLEDPAGDPRLQDRIRESMAGAQYYMTWLMRLEGAAREEWEPEIESSRQNYRLLAERADAAGQPEPALWQRQNLEAAVRLARMDLTDLQGLPLPCQCRGCCSGKCNSRKKPGRKDNAPQAKDARGASAGAPGDGQGS